MLEINGEILSFLDEETGQIMKNDHGFYRLEDVVKYVFNKHGIENYEFAHVGGFDSPGYNVDCYSWSAIIDGELYFDHTSIESY